MTTGDTPDTGSADAVTPPTTPGAAAPLTPGPVVGLGEAVKLTGRSRSTLQRRLRAGELEGAYQRPDGSWSIPVGALIRDGLMPNSTPAPAGFADANSGPVTPPAPPADALTDLRIRVAELAAELAAAQTIAAERAEHLRDLRTELEYWRLMAGRQLEAAAPPAPGQRRRWWHRGQSG